MRHDTTARVRRGRFITFEGVEGCGKSTQAARLAEALAGRGVEVVSTREPGGTPTGEMIRGILQHQASGERVAPTSEMLLFAASRAQHVARVIRPALSRGATVLCDRFVDSSLAYQGVAREMGVERVLAANEIALEGLWPDVTLWFDLPVEEALGRVASRGERPDTFETEALDFHRRVAAGYGELARRFSERVVRIDAAGSEEAVAGRVMGVLEPRSLEEA